MINKIYSEINSPRRRPDQSLLDILFPPENSALLTVGLPTRHQDGPDSVGVSMFRTHEMQPGWVPPVPRGGGVLPTGAASPIGACRFPTASPIPR
jgi:hypothetical protein